MKTQQELLNGIAVTDENGNKLGHFKKAAVEGITQVVISRVTMAAPGMIILPIIMQRLEDNRFMQRITFVHGPLQVIVVVAFLVFMVPVACSLFSQQCSMGSVQYVYFNKGL